MKKKERKMNNTPWFVLAGAVLGGAAALYYLNTPKGKKFRKSVKKSTEELSNNIKEKVESSMESVSETTHDILDKAKDVKKNLISGLQDKTYDRLDSFEKGITKAKNKLKTEANV
jgi:gas vesicle protein